MVGAAPGASCFGPAYEFAMILDRDLRKRKLRDKVPMTYVTPEPYIGHMALGGVGDSKGLMETEFRQRHVHWITNAKITAVRDGEMEVAEVDEDGQPKKTHVLPFKYSMVLPAFTGVPAVRQGEGLCNPRCQPDAVATLAVGHRQHGHAGHQPVGLRGEEGIGLCPEHVVVGAVARVPAGDVGPAGFHVHFALPPRTTGRPLAAHAAMPPSTLT